MSSVIACIGLLHGFALLLHVGVMLAAVGAVVDRVMGRASALDITAVYLEAMPDPSRGPTRRLLAEVGGWALVAGALLLVAALCAAIRP